MPNNRHRPRGRGLEWLVIVFLFAVEIAVVRSPATRAADELEAAEAADRSSPAP
ncbi:hypothetical protein L6V77_28470 [Myxococcota bacterium]|nr:hypothetical protein [Myxococcota bacterium]